MDPAISIIIATIFFGFSVFEFCDPNYHSCYQPLRWYYISVLLLVSAICLSSYMEEKKYHPSVFKAITLSSTGIFIFWTNIGLAIILSNLSKTPKCVPLHYHTMPFMIIIAEDILLILALGRLIIGFLKKIKSVKK